MPFCATCEFVLAPPMSLLSPTHPVIIFVRSRKGTWGTPTTLFAPPCDSHGILTHNVDFFTPCCVFCIPLPVFVAPYKYTTQRYMSVSVCAGLSSPHTRAVPLPPPHVCVCIYSTPYHSKIPPHYPSTNHNMLTHTSNMHVLILSFYVKIIIIIRLDIQVIAPHLMNGLRKNRLLTIPLIRGLVVSRDV